MTPQRLATLLLSLVGLRLSWQASHNIRAVRAQAEAGDRSARNHFTQTRYAHLFGPRNSDLGLLFYGFMALAALCNGLRLWPVRLMALGGSIASATVSLYLLWALLFRLRVRCVICFQSHAVNLALLALMVRRGRER